MKTWRNISVISLIAISAVWADDARGENAGKDGAFTVSGNNVVVNEYSLVSGAVSPGQTSVTVSSVAGDLPSLTPGDLVLLYQAQGALIDQSDTTNYGAILSLRNAGRYEYQTVASISGNTVTFEAYNGSCGGVENSYDSGEVQMIRVPQYTTLSVPSGTTLSAKDWDGQTAGVMAVHVEGAMNVAGIINLNARGFRGGAVDNQTSPTNSTNKPNGYRSTDPVFGAEKGESIAGFQTDYTSGRYGRGAPPMAAAAGTAIMRAAAAARMATTMSSGRGRAIPTSPRPAGHRPGIWTD